MWVVPRTSCPGVHPSLGMLFRKKSKTLFASVKDPKVNCPNQGLDPNTNVLSTLICVFGGIGISGNCANAEGEAAEASLFLPLELVSLEILDIEGVWEQPPEIDMNESRLAPTTHADMVFSGR